MELKTIVFDIFTILGGLTALYAVVKGVSGSLSVFMGKVRQRFAKKSKYIKTSQKISFVEGRLDKFSKGVRLVPPRSKYKNQPDCVFTYYDQTRLVLEASFGDKSIRLPYDFVTGYDHDYDGDYKHSWEKNGNEYMLAFIDINDDELYELLFIVIDTSVDFVPKVQINVFQYHPPANEKDVLREENWSLIGNLKASCNTGEVAITIANKSIRVRAHFRDWYHDWHYVDGGFIDKGDT